MGFQAICKAKTSCVSCKTVGEKLATPLPFLSFPPPALSLSLSLFLFPSLSKNKGSLQLLLTARKKIKYTPNLHFAHFQSLW